MASHPLPIPDKKAKFNKGQFLKLAPQLLGLMRPHVKTLAVGFSALIAASFLNLLFPYLIKEYLNKNIGQILAENLYKLTLVLIALFLLQGIFFYLRHYYLQIVGLKITTDLKNRLIKKLLHHEIAFFDESKVGDLLSRLSSDTDALQRGLSVNISVGLRYGIQVIFGMILMISISPLLTLIIIGLIPLLAVLSIRFSQGLKRASSKTQELMGASSVAADEALTAIRVVKLFNAEAIESSRYSNLNKEALFYADKRTKLAASFSSSMSTLLHCAIAIIFLVGGIFVSNNSLTIGDFTAFLLYCVIVAVSFGFFLNAWAEFVQSLGAAERIYEILDGKSEGETTKENIDPNKNITSHGLNNTIEFHNVHFCYSSRPEVTVLNDINLIIPENKTTAIVGPSGSGKSTIVSLIPRLYTINTGQILLGDININNFTPEQLRSRITFVPQQPQLFSTSLRENLIYGKPNATEMEIQQIIDDAALSDVVSRLPDGLNTLIGDKGIQLSGGERQRVSIARALLVNPKILILDEATSSLDSHNENLIQIALDKARENRTVIIIAHRLSTVKNADHVIVINKGKVEQTGNHLQLCKLDGLYKTLVNFQLA